MSKITEVNYRYTDAGNYKFSGVFHVRGKIERFEFKPFMFQRTFFIPERFGLNPLRPICMNSDDYELHEISGLKYTTGAFDILKDVFLSKMRYFHH